MSNLVLAPCDPPFEKSWLRPCVDLDTGAHTQRIENTWREVQRRMPRTGTSKDLFESYLEGLLWRQHYGDDPFGNIIKHIADLYAVRKDA